MNIYFINLDNKKYKQYKTYENAFIDVKKMISQFPTSTIEIILEEYCEFGHYESCCKLFILYKYENGIVK